MRHFVNIALVPFFLTLVVTGLLRFLVPFSLVTTRVHVIFGLGVLVLVALHIATRPEYFVHALRSVRSGEESDLVTRRMIAGVVSVWIGLLVAALWNYPPVTSIIGFSYESRKRQVIFRPDDRTVYKPVGDGLDLKRTTDDDASLLVKVDWGGTFPAPYGRAGGPLEEARPQVAIWAESETGDLIETFYLSETVAFQEQFGWGGHSLSRVDVLPVWRHRFTLKTGIKPSGEKTEFTGATPEHSFSVHSYLRTDSEPFYLYVSVNAPGDTNDFYHPDQDQEAKGYVKPGLGQPSIIYGTYIEPKKQKQYKLLDLVGHGGSTSTRDGNIHYDLENLTTAKQLIEKILVRVQRSEPAGSKDQKEEIVK